MIRSAESMRDPAGAVVRQSGRVYRLVASEGEANARTFLASPSIVQRRGEGSCIPTRVLPREEWPNVPGTQHAALVLEHEPIGFPTYPYEWSPGMLQAAGALMLELATELSREGAGLKDATPFNILFRGFRPVFIDVLSVEERDLHDPIWFAYGQFVRTFLLPMIAARDLGWTLRRSFTGSRDGLDPAMLYARLNWSQRLRAPSLSTITGPVLLAKLGLATTVPPIERRRTEPRRARFVVERIIGQLTRALEQATPRALMSDWTGYADPGIHPPEYHSARRETVAAILAAHRPRRLLDVGANDGTFAQLAASAGAEVVAIDRDEAVVERMYRNVSAVGGNVLPLVVDLIDPTPATGWRNLERSAFLERASGQFDAVLCLAVLHHLVVGDGLALREVMSLLSSLTTDLLVAEFVPATDVWCAKLARGRPVTEERWSEAAFEVEARRWFTIEGRHAEGLRGRTLYILRRHAAAPDVE